MRKIERRHLVTTAILLVPLFCCDALLAQGDGDYNGDGYVDLTDYDDWDACMAGPGGGLPDPDCAAFDFGADTDVDIVDFGGFMVAFTGPSPCTFGRKYAHVTKPEEDATGCSAKIITRPTTLCGESTNSDSSAASAAHVGVHKQVGETPVIWAQIGYTRFRAPGSTIVLKKRYAETKWGPGENDKDLKLDTAPSSGTHEYRCFMRTRLLGTWTYEYDLLPFHVFDHLAWKRVTGTHYAYQAEIFNKEDYMLGFDSSKCKYTECKFAKNWQAGFLSTSISDPPDLRSSDDSKWGIERVSSTAFNVWDKRP